MEQSSADLAQTLYEFAASIASTTYGRQFKPIAAGRLRKLTRMAAEEVIQPHRFGDRSAAEATKGFEERVADAKASVAALVAEMASYAESLPHYEKDKLGEQTLTYAMVASRFCPCWPFC